MRSGNKNATESARHVVSSGLNSDGAAVPPRFARFAAFALLFLAARFAAAAPGDFLLPFRHGDRWGFADTNGAVVIGPRFPEVDFFHEGLAKVVFRNRTGYIDPQGKFAIPPTYINGGKFSQGLAPVTADGYENYGFINTNGDWVIPPTFIFAMPFGDEPPHHAYVRTQSAIGKFFAPIALFLETRFGVDEFLITPKGERSPLFPPAVPRPCFDGRRWLYGFTTGDGRRVLVKPKYGHAGYFREGLAEVKEGDGWGYLGTNLQFAIRPVFKRAGAFENGHACAMDSSGLWGIIDVHGDFVVQPRFKRIHNFHDGLALVTDTFGKDGYVDLSGEIAISNVFDSASDFFRGFAKVERDGKSFYIDRAGRPVVWAEVDTFESGMNLKVAPGESEGRGKDPASFLFRGKGKLVSYLKITEADSGKEYYILIPNQNIALPLETLVKESPHFSTLPELTNFVWSVDREFEIVESQDRPIRQSHWLPGIKLLSVPE